MTYVSRSSHHSPCWINIHVGSCDSCELHSFAWIKMNDQLSSHLTDMALVSPCAFASPSRLYARTTAAQVETSSCWSTFTSPPSGGLIWSCTSKQSPAVQSHARPLLGRCLQEATLSNVLSQWCQITMGTWSSCIVQQGPRDLFPQTGGWAVTPKRATPRAQPGVRALTASRCNRTTGRQLVSSPIHSWCLHNALCRKEWWFTLFSQCRQNCSLDIQAGQSFVSYCAHNSCWVSTFTALWLFIKRQMLCLNPLMYWRLYTIIYITSSMIFAWILHCTILLLIYTGTDLRFLPYRASVS